MGWGPIEWVGRVLPEAKFEKKCTSFFEIFGFERLLLRYLQKPVCTKVHIEEKKCSYIATINLYLIYYKAPLVVTKSSLILDLALN